MLVQEIFFPAFAALVGPVQGIFFLAVHYVNSIVPIAQQAGQAVVQGRLSLNLCLWFLPQVFAGLQFLSRSFYNIKILRKEHELSFGLCVLIYAMSCGI